ncbi:ENR1 protein, partial [Smithornis capensis]|nr:ENR1 protein [Smithornis capensis]
YKIYQGNIKKSNQNPFSGIKKTARIWKNMTATTERFWKAPSALLWICGKWAYPELPADWRGSCTLGVIHPGFFLLPSNKGDTLGVPV